MGFISYTESQQIINDIKIDSKTTLMPLMLSVGFILSSDIVASENSPTAPTSGMDGYAFAYEDMALGKLLISGVNPAGGDNSQEIQTGTCVKTFTGSLMPHGSDTLVPIELVDVIDGYIVFKENIPRGFSVRAIGENYSESELLIPKGTKIDFAQIGVLASLNILEVEVYAKPRVAVLATGSELLELGEIQTRESQIRSSNNLVIEVIASKYGANPTGYGCTKDDKSIITHAVQKALSNNDIVITTGGVSVGDYDFVKDVVREIGFEVLFQGVSIKPGQHIMLARKDNQFILALPGFAYSATVTALLYLLPLIGKFTNSTNTLKSVKAILREPFSKKSNKDEFIACNLIKTNGKYECDFTDKKVGTSAILTNLLGNTTLLHLYPSDTTKDIGDEVDVLLFD
jgi:molybdopterin molybdotransferase